jgi:uncharacterized membrane protein YphA (DoxX/SURF4 family)
MKAMISFLMAPKVGDAPKSVLLVRVALGLVFLSSGSLKFLFENQGVLRFAKLGLPPGLAFAVGALEIVGGVMVLAGASTRLAGALLAVDMVGAIVMTKLPLLFGPGPEPVLAEPKTGVLAFAYQARLDFTMLLGCAFLVAAGAGVWSVDAWLSRRRGEALLIDRARKLG